MSLSVNSYLKVIPPGNKNQEKPKLLNYFAEGVNRCGDNGMVIKNFHHYPSDVAILQGFVHPGSKHVPHLNLRREILENQKKAGKRTIIADSNLFLYADPDNTKTYLRYSYDGVFPNTGEYCDSEIDPQRWEKIQKDLGIFLKPYRKPSNDGHILICAQRDGGWSMDGIKLIPWLHPLVNRLQRITDRPIRIRLHPGDKKHNDHIKRINTFKWKNVTVSPLTRPLLVDFQNCHAVINHNSSPTVAALIEGIPVFVLDPAKSQVAEIAQVDVREIENPRQFDRLPTMQRLSMFHWTLEELRNGTCWKHMRKWAKK